MTPDPYFPLTPIFPIFPTQFTYTLTDGRPSDGGSATGTVTVTVGMAIPPEPLKVPDFEGWTAPGQAIQVAYPTGGEEPYTYSEDLEMDGYFTSEYLGTYVGTSTVTDAAGRMGNFHWTVHVVPGQAPSAPTRIVAIRPNEDNDDAPLSTATPPPKDNQNWDIGPNDDEIAVVRLDFSPGWGEYVAESGTVTVIFPANGFKIYRSPSGGSANVLTGTHTVNITNTADPLYGIVVNNEPIYVETAPGTLQSAEITLTSNLTLADGRVGFNVNGKLPLLPVEILDKNKLPITKLKVAKMAEPAVLTGTGTTATLNIELDPDHFYVRLVGAANLGVLSIKVATVENEVASYNDNETEIDNLYYEGNDLITESMLLVADDVDDKHPVDSIADEAKNDRTHKVQLGGKFQVKSIKIGLGAVEHGLDVRTPVPVIKTVKVKFYNCKSGFGGGSSIVGPEDLALLKTTTNERFAQCGIRIEWSVADGVKVGILAYLSGPPTWAGPGTTIDFPKTSRDFFLNPLMPFADDEIPVYAVGGIGDKSGPDDKGYATAPSVMSQADITAKLANKCLLGREWNRFTPSHELLHVLLNAHHYDGGGPYATEYGNPKMIWCPTVSTGKITDTKRISHRQADDILGTSSTDPKSPFPQ